MQPTVVRVGDLDYRIVIDQDNVTYPIAAIPTFALRRVVGLSVNSTKTVDFVDLQGNWLIDSCYISSPQTSEIEIDIINEQNNSIFTDKLVRNETPKAFPSVLINSTLKINLTAKRAEINLVLIYLKPAYLAYSKDF